MNIVQFLSSKLLVNALIHLFFNTFIYIKQEIDLIFSLMNVLYNN